MSKLSDLESVICSQESSPEQVVGKMVKIYEFFFILKDRTYKTQQLEVKSDPTMIEVATLETVKLGC